MSLRRGRITRDEEKARRAEGFVDSILDLGLAVGVREESWRRSDGAIGRLDFGGLDPFDRHLALEALELWIASHNGSFVPECSRNRKTVGIRYRKAGFDAGRV